MKKAAEVARLSSQPCCRIDPREPVKTRAAAARNSLKRVSAWTSVTAVATDRPDTSRQRTHRFTSSRSQGWVTRSNRRWLLGRGRLALVFRPGSLHNRQTSRWYSTSHDTVLQVVGVSLDRVRRLLDRGPDTPETARQARPAHGRHRAGSRLDLGVRHENALHAHRTSRLRDGKRKVIPSTTPP